jgi:hypothetical protein
VNYRALGVVLVRFRAYLDAIVQQFLQQSQPGNCVPRQLPLEARKIKEFIKVFSARLLANGQPLKAIQIENNLKIELPPQTDDLNVSTIAVMCRGRKYWHARAKPYTNTISAKAQ